MNREAAPDPVRPTVLVLIIGVLIVGSLWTLLPFIGSLVWATAIVSQPGRCCCGCSVT